MPGRNHRALLILAILVIAQGALSPAWAASRCLSSADCGPRASSPCPMGMAMDPGASPCDEMSAECGGNAGPKLLCGEICARVFSKAPALLAFAPEALPAPAAGVAIEVSLDPPQASSASGATLAPLSRGRPAIYLSTRSLLI